MGLPLTRLLMALLVGFAFFPPPGAASDHDPDLLLSQNVPEGVAFQVLAEHQSQVFRFHTDVMRLDRITLDCGQATGRVFGMEQLTYVEYGSVDVHDWNTGERISTLSAGESFGPMNEESSFFLASSPGHSASVYRFSHGGAGAIDDAQPAVSFETTRCDSGVQQEMPVAQATIETLFVSECTSGTSFSNDFVVYAGLLTIEPGSALGWFDSNRSPAYVSNGSGVMLPLLGGFGSGAVGMGGVVDSGVGPREVVSFGSRQQVSLENHGSVPTIALIFGVLEVGKPVFQALHR